MNILVVEDDTLLSAALTKMLTANHYTIAVAYDGQTGLDLAMAIEYDLILLDLQIPKLDGISVCKQLRSQGYHKPILLLTAKDSNKDIVAGLDAGADDYVIKPYNPLALLARIRALLRRKETIISSILNWGELHLNLTSAKLTFKQQEILLTATEYKLIELFLQNPTRIFSRSVILDRLWGFDDAPTEAAVTTHIKDLRKKLKTAGLTEDILETVYGIGYRLKSISENLVLANSPSLETENINDKPKTKNIDSLNQVLSKFRHSFNGQIAILEQAQIAFLADNLTEELYQAAKHEAHKLAGSMGSFGYPEGSKLARKAENLLLNTSALSSSEISQFSELVTALKQELSKDPVTLRTESNSMKQAYRLLVIDDDQILTDSLQTGAENWGFRLKIAADLAMARWHLSLASPEVILLDLSFASTEEDGLILLRELTERSPDIPVIVFTGRNTLADRLAVSRLGAKQFLHKPATTEQIFETITRVLFQKKTSKTKVLIVDDDAIMLDKLSAILTPWGLEVVTLSAAEKFWEVLITKSPDLVLLDLEMPMVNGLELCKIVRQDAYWRNLPILIVTAHTDQESLQKAFAVGANDFITKPIFDIELITRVLSHIKRINS